MTSDVILPDGDLKTVNYLYLLLHCISLAAHVVSYTDHADSDYTVLLNIKIKDALISKIMLRLFKHVCLFKFYVLYK